MKKKPIYKLMDDRGRVLVPKELRDAADMHFGNIIRLDVHRGVLAAKKVDIIEVGDQSPEAREAYVFAAVKSMDTDTRLSLAARLLELVEREG